MKKLIISSALAQRSFRYVLNIDSDNRVIQSIQKYIAEKYLPEARGRNPRMDELLAKINGSSRFNAENSAKAFIEAIEKSKGM